MVTSVSIPENKRLLVGPAKSKNNFDVVRVLLAIAVIVSHAAPVELGIGASEPLSGRLRGTTLGEVAVGGFFAISGYLVTASWCNSTPFRYLQKRAARILPGFVVACAITILLACVTSTYPLKTLNCTRWSNAILTTATFRRPVVCFAYSSNPYVSETNASLWTIKYEVGCYAATALFGFAGLLLSKKRKSTALIFGILTIAGAVLGCSGFARNPLGSAIRLSAFYAGGMVVYLFRDRLPRSRRLMIVCLLAIALASFSRFLVLLALPTAGVYLLFRFIYADRLFVSTLKSSAGDLSYGMYLYGWPVAQSLIAIFGAGVFRVWLLAGVSVLACLPIAYVSWRFVESPFLSLVQKT